MADIVVADGYNCFQEICEMKRAVKINVKGARRPRKKFVKRP